MEKKEKDILADNLTYIVDDILPILDSNFILTDNYDIVSQIYKHTKKSPTIYIVRKLHFGQDALHFNISVKDYSNILHVYVGLNTSELPFIPLLITDLPYTLEYIDSEYLETFLFNPDDLEIEKMIKFYISMLS
jgi:hypothetical protein